MHRLFLLCEWLVLFILIPIILWAEILPVRPLWLLPIPLLYCLIIYRRNKMTPSEKAPKEAYIKLMIRGIFVAICLTVIVYFLHRESFFIIPIKMPKLWCIILIFYPIISALPQEFIYRQFYFERYNELFRGHNKMIWSSALTFSWLHIFYHNWIAILFTLLGGFALSLSYQRTRSLRLIWLEHSFYGLWIFTVGLGSYFFHP